MKTKMNLKTMATVIALIPVFTSGLGAQELIINPGFDAGQIVTGPSQITKATGWEQGCGKRYDNISQTYIYTNSADLIDNNSTSVSFDEPHQNGPSHTIISQDGDGRFAAFCGSAQTNPAIYPYITYPAEAYAESIKGSLTAPLNGYMYNIGFWAAGKAVSTNGVLHPNLVIQAVLRKNTDCTTEKVVYTTPVITSLDWQHYTGTFSLTAADVAQGYDKIEFRVPLLPNAGGATWGLVDNASLVAITPTPAFIFTNANTCLSTKTENSPYGPQLVTIVGLPNIYIDGSASTNENGYHISIDEFNMDANTWSFGVNRFNGWISSSGPVPANINLASLVPANTFQSGILYRIALTVGPGWNTAARFMRIGCASTASFVFSNLNSCVSTANESSPYGPQQVTTMHKSNVYIDGSASSNENGYHISVDEFNMNANTWSFGVNKFNGWISPTGQVPSSINLVTLGNGLTFTPGILYRVALSVGPNWHTDAKFFRVINCTHQPEFEEVLPMQQGPEPALRIFPNPGNGWFTISAGDEPVEKMVVKDVSGKTIYEGAGLAGAAVQQVDLTAYATGVYFVKVYTPTNVLTGRIIKN